MKKSSKNIAILIEDQYQVLEVWYPYYRLKEEGFNVTLIGSGTKDVYPSKEGYPAAADISIQKAEVRDYDGVIIPGGWAPDFLRRHSEIINFVKRLYVDGRVIAAICHGGWMLVSAGIIKDKRVTCFSAIKDDLIAAGGKYSDQEVVVDKNIITSRKPDDLPLFVKEIIKLIRKG